MIKHAGSALRTRPGCELTPCTALTPHHMLTQPLALNLIVEQPPKLVQFSMQGCVIWPAGLPTGPKIQQSGSTAEEVLTAAASRDTSRTAAINSFITPLLPNLWICRDISGPDDIAPQVRFGLHARG